MLLALGLGTHLVGRDHQNGAVHEAGAAEHDGHQRFMARCVNEAHDTQQLGLGLA